MFTIHEINNDLHLPNDCSMSIKGYSEILKTHFTTSITKSTSCTNKSSSEDRIVLIVDTLYYIIETTVCTEPTDNKCNKKSIEYFKYNIPAVVYVCFVASIVSHL